MNNFNKCLADSHSAEDLPFWKEVYSKAFPNMVSMNNHRKDGEHQRLGIDRSIVLENGKILWIDEKVRFKNNITGKIYTDIALEYISDDRRQIPGWVCKSIMADYIAYAIAPLGKCYLLPVTQLQNAWQKNKELWLKNYKIIIAENGNGNDVEWITLSCCIPVKVLFIAIGACLRVDFTTFT